VGSPHVHSSHLVPVSFAGFLIKCPHFISTTWAFAQVRPHVTLRGRLRAVWALSTAGCCPLFFVLRSVHGPFMSTGYYRPAAVRRGSARRLCYIRPWGAVPCVFSFVLSMFYVYRPAAVRHGYVRHLGYIRPWGAGPGV